MLLERLAVEPVPRPELERTILEALRELEADRDRQAGRKSTNMADQPREPAKSVGTFIPLAGGLALGVVESFAVSILPAAYKDVVTLTLLLAVLVVRPSGLFSSREAARLRDF